MMMIFLELWKQVLFHEPLHVAIALMSLPINSQTLVRLTSAFLTIYLCKCKIEFGCKYFVLVMSIVKVKNQKTEFPVQFHLLIVILNQGCRIYIVLLIAWYRNNTGMSKIKQNKKQRKKMKRNQQVGVL